MHKCSGLKLKQNFSVIHFSNYTRYIYPKITSTLLLDLILFHIIQGVVVSILNTSIIIFLEATFVVNVLSYQMSDQGNWGEITRNDGFEYRTDLSSGTTWARAIGSEDPWVQVPPESVTEARPVGRREFHTDGNNIDWSRKVNSDGTREQWRPLQQQTTSESVSLPVRNCLWLCRNEQPTPQPFHWFLAVSPEDGGKCTVYQVEGDAVDMHYSHATDSDAFHSPVFRDCYEMAKLDITGEDWVKHFANQEPPPQATNQATVTENCQDWSIRVLRALRSVNVVPSERISEVEAMLDYNEDGRRNFG